MFINGSELILDDLGEDVGEAMGDEKPLSLDFLGSGQITFSLSDAVDHRLGVARRINIDQFRAI